MVLSRPCVKFCSLLSHLILILRRQGINFYVFGKQKYIQTYVYKPILWEWDLKGILSIFGEVFWLSYRVHILHIESPRFNSLTFVIKGSHVAGAWKEPSFYPRSQRATVSQSRWTNDLTHYKINSYVYTQRLGLSNQGSACTNKYDLIWLSV